MPTYIASYIVSDGEISLNTDGTRTLSSLAGERAFMRITRRNGQSVVIDLAHYQLRQRNLDLTMTLAGVASGLTDLQIDAYAAACLPTLDPVTDRFAARIGFYDALAAEDVQVDWTSIGSPGIRNDIYQRGVMQDLVITSTRRDLRHSLVAVNGVFHKTYFHEHQLYVKDGFANIKNARRTQIGIYDTTAVGGHDLLPIEIANIDASNRTPFSGVTLTFPHADFTGKTILMVLGGYLHALDDTYRIIGRNRVVIDTGKIDLINGFIHNPNTMYTRDALHDRVFEDRLEQHRDAPPTVRDKIMWYLWNGYPKAEAHRHVGADLLAFDPPERAAAIPVADRIAYYLTNSYPWARANTVTPANVMAFTRQPARPRDKPSVSDAIYAFLEAYPALPPAAPMMCVDYEWTTKYKRLVSIIGALPGRKFAEPAFIYNTLLSEHTFFVLVDNPALFVRRYRLSPVQRPSQYIHRGADTPRGILFYNHQQTLPYTVYSDARRVKHNFSLDYEQTCADAYKTALNPIAIPSPQYDLKCERVEHAAVLLELYAAA
jgi:hypothetical protein